MYANSGTSTKIPDGSHIVLPSRSRGSMQHQENTFKRSTSASDVSFLGRSPRRMSRKATNRRSTMSSIEAANSTMMVSTQFQSDMLVDMQSFFLPDVASYSSCSASSSSPHSVYADMNDFIPCVDPFEFERSSDELTKLLNKVFYEQKDNHVSADMVRSATTTSTASSSSSPIHHLRHTMCGSIIPHASCSALVGQPQKESVMVTITPLSNQQQEVPQFDSHQASSSRIVTCYFGSNCVCPGCLVHPNNATLMQNSIYSNYNSDDDEQFIYPQPTMSDTMF
ncbi:uncharacterized protein B0P05DRAFT_569687 [Gilbertella persicaria]|uniref:uncharacterized protein n=1 Tax=Gilbertella persicaria TaxID=101096 RepID=UPI0022203BCB|nr:uncharacterized protein B0P05DRAFT_569687 [Gilbertella persicaria]KAI8087752.1 hypothetical protein B0P05DRAFT_569687 [Gilbertella persicaria]